MSFPTPAGDAVEGLLLREPQVCLGPAFASASYQFNLTGTSTPANVYQDGNLSTAFPITGLVTADAFGRFPPIYLDPAIIYQVVFSSPNGVTWTQDPYTPPLSTRGTSQLTSYGIQVSSTGEVTVPAPNAGGSTISMIVKAGVLGTAAVKISSTLPGQPALIINSSVTTGAQTATFTATNKPGTATSSPAGWLPIQCDGTIYYTPIWHGNNFSPYVAAPTAVGEVINAVYVTFNGNGSTTVAAGGSATPSSWFVPNAAGVGAGYWINITKTAGNSGTSFNTAQGSWVNITSGGLVIGTAGSVNTVLKGTYQLSTSAGGSPVVANGTIQLSGNTTGASPGTGANDNVVYNGSAALVLAGNGTATLNGVASTNWFLPTTASTGHLYWINITRTGGTGGVNFSAAQGSFTNITDGGLTINLTGNGQRNATGTYQISSNSGGTAIVASGTISLTASGVNNSNWSGTAPLKLNGDGSATLNGVATSNWFSPITANVGAGYWIDITRTSGTSGVNFSAAQGSWTNITNSGLSISLSGTSGNVGTVTANGTYQISNSSSGSPVLGSGTVSLSISGLTVIHVYTSVVSGATETIPTGSTTVAAECWAGGGGGCGGIGVVPNNTKGGGAGAGGYCRRSINVAGQAGHTFTYTIGGGGAVGTGGASGSTGGTSNINAGTVTGWTNLQALGGVGGSLNAGGAGGTASGGTTNTTGAAGAVVAGGTGTTGNISGDGSPYGTGGSGSVSGNQSPSAGSPGAAVFFYS